jgi:hypothetical protein
MPGATFRIGRNPDPDSRLPFLLGLPVSGAAPVVLACAVDWPGAKDAFCHQLPAWPDDGEVLAEVPVERCERRGQAVHLVLRRQQRRRSMFVWTISKGREIIFWRTPGTMASARPGLKVAPARGLDAPLEIAVDARERYAWRFGDQPVTLVRRQLPVGDYGVFDGDTLCAVVERKRPGNLAGDAVGGTLGFALADLERVPHACVVVDGRLSDVFKAAGDHVKPGWLMSVLAALQVAHPRVPVIYAETRDLAEDYAFRWLAAARKAQREGGAAGQVAESVPLFQAGPSAGVVVLDRVGRQVAALRQARAGRAWTASEYAAAFGVGHQTAWLDLVDLVDRGDLAAEGSRRTRRYVGVRRSDRETPVDG